ncbi:MAG: hypothetical protein JWP57_261 [Spirosoma sp.]|nr:hypothetical protein [Spirosoma sp.]
MLLFPIRMMGKNYAFIFLMGKNGMTGCFWLTVFFPGFQNGYTTMKSGWLPNSGMAEEFIDFQR